MQGFLSSYAQIWKRAAPVTTTPPADLSAVEEALIGALGDAVSTAPDRLGAYVADTYWPALYAADAGAPIARPDVVVRPRSEEDVAAVLRLADAHGVPVVPWGGGSGTQGGALADRGRDRHRPDLARRDRRDRRGLADRDRPGRRQRQAARGRAQRPRADAPALPRVGRVGDRRRLHRGARLGRPLDPLREDRGPAAVAPRRDAGRRADRDRRGPAPRGRPRAHAALRRLGGHARRDHARHAPARPAAGGAPLRGRRVPVRRRRHPRHPPRAAGRPPAVGRADVRRRRHAADVRARGRRGPARDLHRARLRGRGGGRRAGGAADARDRRRGRRRAARPGAGPALVGPPLRLLPPAPPAGAARDLGHARRRRDLRPDRRGLRRARHERCASRMRTPGWSCGCTSRTGTCGAR